MDIKTSVNLTLGKPVFDVPGLGLTQDVMVYGTRPVDVASTAPYTTNTDAYDITRVSATEFVVAHKGSGASELYLTVYTHSGSLITESVYSSVTLTNQIGPSSYPLLIRKVTATTYLVMYVTTSNTAVAQVITYNETTKLFSSPGTAQTISAGTVYTLTAIEMSAGVFVVAVGASTPSNGVHSRVLTITGTTVAVGTVITMSGEASYSHSLVYVNATTFCVLHATTTNLNCTRYTVSGTSITQTGSNAVSSTHTTGVTFWAGLVATNKLLVTSAANNVNRRITISFVDVSGAAPGSPVTSNYDFDCLHLPTHHHGVYESGTNRLHLTFNVNSLTTANPGGSMQASLSINPATNSFTVIRQTFHSLIVGHLTNAAYFKVPYLELTPGVFVYRNTNSLSQLNRPFVIDFTRQNERWDMFVGYPKDSTTVRTYGEVTGFTGLVPGAVYGEVMDNVLFIDRLCLSTPRSFPGYRSREYWLTNTVKRSVNLLALTPTKAFINNPKYPR